MTDLSDFARLVARDHGLCVVSTLRPPSAAADLHRVRRDARRLGHLRPGHGRRTPHRRAGHAGSRLHQRLMAAARDGQGLCGLAGWAVARWAVARWAVAGWAVAME